VPFIARYRKEATGTLDDAQLRTLEERLRYLRELDERRAAILESISAQGKLDAELEGRIMAADSKARLEDIYLPYKPKRRTKAQIAREAGLEPLATLLLADPGRDPQQAAADYVDAEHGVAEVVRRLLTRVGDAPVYVSVDIDVLDPAHAPGTGTPEAGGLTSRELLALVRGLRSASVVGGDVVEVSPAYDHAEITAIAAAHVLYDLVTIMASAETA